MKIFSLATIAIWFLCIGCGKQPAPKASVTQTPNENSDADSVNSEGSLRQPDMRTTEETKTTNSNRESELKPLVVELLDEADRPVSDAEVGVFADWSDINEFVVPPKILLREPGSRRMQRGAVSGEDGLVKLTSGELFSDGSRAEALFAFQRERGLVGLRRISPADLGGNLTMRLSSACRVRLRMENAGQPVDLPTVYIFSEDTRPISRTSRNSDAEFLLPAGKYSILCYGNNTEQKRLWLDIEPGQKELELHVDLAPSRLSMLQGKPAPELREIKGWKNGGPVQIKDLRGRVILLYFWGHWCSPCLRDMPKMMELHDRYKDQGLTIIAVHDDSVKSIADMEAKLLEARTSIWNGRDIPFVVALDGGGERPIPGGSRQEARGATTATYGIRSFPTTLLIDRQGVLMGEFSGWDTLRNRLNQSLSEGAETPAGPQ